MSAKAKIKVLMIATDLGGGDFHIAFYPRSVGTAIAAKCDLGLDEFRKAVEDLANEKTELCHTCVQSPVMETVPASWSKYQIEKFLFL